MSITARVGRLLAASAAAILSSLSIAAADVPTRAEIEYQINQMAPHWMIDADNHHLVLVRLHLPRQDGDLGTACGAILPVGSPRFNEQKNSYWATLSMRDGIVSEVVPVSRTVG